MTRYVKLSGNNIVSVRDGALTKALITTETNHGLTTGNGVTITGGSYAGNYSSVTVVGVNQFLLGNASYAADETPQVGTVTWGAYSPTVHTTTLTAGSGNFSWHVGSTSRSVQAIGNGGNADAVLGGGGGGGGCAVLAWSNSEVACTYTVGAGGSIDITTITNGSETCTGDFGIAGQGTKGGAGASGGNVGDSTSVGGTGGSAGVTSGGGGGGGGGNNGNGSNGNEGTPAGTGLGGAAGEDGTAGLAGAGGQGKLVNGDNGSNYGGGGGGGLNNGGTGAPGILVCTEIY